MTPLAQKIREHEHIIVQSDASVGQVAHMVASLHAVLVEAAKVADRACQCRKDMNAISHKSRVAFGCGNSPNCSCSPGYRAEWGLTCLWLGHSILAAWDEAHREPKP